jgi:hypothetical protein
VRGAQGIEAGELEGTAGVEPGEEEANDQRETCTTDDQLLLVQVAP